ncbi:MAG: hypothetical protein VXY73_16625 [Pseudomonadota bacterium]|nr:hypothetical protein [Pseudomonadota bacterium]
MTESKKQNATETDETDLNTDQTETPDTDADQAEGEVAETTEVSAETETESSEIDAPTDEVEDAEVIVETDDTLTDPEPVEEPVAETPPPPPTPEPVVEKSGGSGFTAVLLGGVVAAGLGFVAAQFAGPLLNSAPETPDYQAQMDALSKQIAELADRPAPEPADPAAALETALGDSLSGITDGLGAVADQLTQLDGRIVTLENRPLVQGPAELAATIDTYERELQETRAQLAEQQALNAELLAKLDATAETATKQLDAAAARAEAIAQSSALLAIQAALDTGEPFATALSGLTGADVPEALSTVADTGVASLSQLQTTYDDAARAALSASLRDLADGDASARISSFLKAQLGLRSLTPREGDDPDAVLSRAQAALDGGDVAAALSELDALPASGQAEMADWRATAQARVDAIAAAGDLAQTLTTN